MSIYLDNSATTKISKCALEKYIEISENCFGNPSSLHSAGHDAELILKAARNELLASAGQRDGTVIFTASGSEANNLAIIGRALSKKRYRGSRIITTDSEHASVNEPLKYLADQGFEIVKVSTRGGEIDLDELEGAMNEKVILVSIMLVNNETGALYDTAAVGRIMREKAPEAILHVDATQGFLKFPFTKRSIGADLITVSSHKIHGPKGIGALIVDKQVTVSRGLSPIIYGGGQEMGLRSGTENVPAIAAFAEAAKEGRAHLSERFEHISKLRDELIESIRSAPELSQISLTLPKKHAPHILNITVPSIKSETLLHYLSSEGIFVSSGSACSSNSHVHSSALIAYGRTEKEADSSLRISFSHENTQDDIKALCEALARAVARLARIR